jgi:hypothetical protein
LDQVKQVMRVKHYALRTEECYTQWIKRFILFHGKRHPRDMGATWRGWSCPTRWIGSIRTPLASWAGSSCSRRGSYRADLSIEEMREAAARLG